MTTVTPAAGVAQSSVNLGHINPTSSSNITLDGITIAGAEIGTDSAASTHFHIINSNFTGTSVVRGGATNSNKDILFDSDRLVGLNQGGGYEGRIEVIGNANGVTISNSYFSQGCSDGVQWFNGADGLVIDHNEFTNMIQGSCAPTHVDPMQSLGGKATITNNYFHNNSTGLMDSDGGLSDNSVISNNVFAAPNEQAVLQLANCHNLLIDHNVFNGVFPRFGAMNTGQVCSNVTVTNNVMTAGFAFDQSQGAFTWDYNLTSDSTARGSHGVNGSPIFQGGSNPTSWSGFALASTSPGHNAASNGKDIGIDASLGGSGGSSDTTPPTVSLTAPANNATVSGSAVTVSANASDDTGVVGVQFKLDGTNLGSEDTSSPYSVTWNASTASNGTHTLTAVARDAAGNSTTSSAITVTVTGGTSVLVGDANVESTSDNNTTGEAEAFKYTAIGTGTAVSASFYLDSSTTANTVKVGVYSNNSGHAGTLLTSGTITSPNNGSWSTTSLSPAVTINSGTTYWIVILGTDGSLAYRDKSSGSCAEGTSATGLTNLPSTWSSGTSYTYCNASVYISGTGGITKTCDFNSDGIVNVFDLSIFLSKWNTNTSAQDLNNDGTVNAFDLSYFLSKWGTSG